MAPAYEQAPSAVEQAEEGEEAKVGFNRSARLKATVASYAINHPARLRALLKTVPESAKPALQRAIDISEAGYKKALKSLD